MKKKICRYKNFEYILAVPDGYTDGEKYPMILLLHGAGARGDDISVHLDYPLFRRGAKYLSEAVVVMPQCFADCWFDIFEQLKDFAAYAIEEYADPSRVYVMGASMGGYATWQMAMSMPERFAAAVPICGGGMYWNAPRLKNLPVWAFHGSEDNVVRAEESRKMVDAVNAAGGDAHLTVYDGVGHNAWDYAYANGEMFSWLFAHKR